MTSDPVVSIIVPARNEELVLADCLRSLTTQAGVPYEVIVVDDHSDDRTAEIAREFENVKVLHAAPLQPGWTGKANAIWTAIPHARGDWLLFTDADTIHLPGSIEKSIAEARDRGVQLLSYSPGQDARSFWERAFQPVVFGELARVYDYDVINDPGNSLAAANGQFILINRQTYSRIGGHEAVAGSLLEDVQLAQRVKQIGKLHFRYAPENVRARMYRAFFHIVEGWTKNLAVLFPGTLRLALLRLLEFCAIAAGPFAALIALLMYPWLVAGLCGISVVAGFLFVRRIRGAGFSASDAVIAYPGLLMFSYLLFRSYFSHRYLRNVAWKGRKYSSSHSAHTH
jgi:glycosyltransferase involved in cell wall biosynthesis